MLLLNVLILSLALVDSIEIAPKIQSVSAPKNIEAGNEVRLMCLVEKGSKPITFKWLRNEIELIAIDNRRINSIDDSMSLLTFTAIKGSDQGNYSCAVQNPAGSDVFQVELKVKGKI